MPPGLSAGVVASPPLAPPPLARHGHTHTPHTWSQAMLKGSPMARGWAAVASILGARVSFSASSRPGERKNSWSWRLGLGYLCAHGSLEIQETESDSYRCERRRGQERCGGKNRVCVWQGRALCISRMGLCGGAPASAQPMSHHSDGSLQFFPGPQETLPCVLEVEARPPSPPRARALGALMLTAHLQPSHQGAAERSGKEPGVLCQDLERQRKQT